MRDPYLIVLVLLNIVLSITLAFYLYRTRQFRVTNQTKFSLVFLFLWILRYFWLLYFLVFESYNDLINRGVALVFSGILISGFFVIQSIFPVKQNQRSGIYIQKTYEIIIVILSLILIPLSLILPSDSIRNDINSSVAFLIALGAVILFIFIIFRVIHRFDALIGEFFKWYNVGLLFGIILVLSGDTLFYWIFSQAYLQLIAPSVGLVIILASFISTRIIPFFQFARMVDTGILIITTKDRKIEYSNVTAQKFIPPLMRDKLTSLSFIELWGGKTRLMDAFNYTLRESRTILVEEQLHNYDQNSDQNIQITFYPLAAEHSPSRIGILIMISDEIEFLKQRKDFLLDIVTHDLANVSQTMLLSLEAITNKISPDNPDWEVYQLMLTQNQRLEQLIFSTQNLLYIDHISSSPKEFYSDFNTRFQELINEKTTEYPKISFITENLDRLMSIETTGNLKAAFSLLIDSIVESLKGVEKTLQISTNIIENTRSQQIIFAFSSNEISMSLFDNYLEENKSAMVASSTYRVNLIVASSIIQKNHGMINITRKEGKLLNTIIVVTLPIIIH